MKISEIITDKYKLRLPPTVYYDLLADVAEAEEEQEQDILGKIRAEIDQVVNQEKLHDEKWALGLKYALHIIDKYRTESEDK